MGARLFTVGERVRLTAAFLRSTGQYTGREPRAVWTVQAVICGGRIIVTDEPRPDDGMFTAEEIAREPNLRYRHVNSANVERVKGDK